MLAAMLAKEFGSVLKITTFPVNETPPIKVNLLQPDIEKLPFLENYF